MNLKERIDVYFFLTEEEMEEGYVVDGATYWWVFLYIIFGFFTMFIALQALVLMQ
ncbi:hypothetical protein QUF56_09225 [Ureibacillus composti]|nr:hypothetical protein [Ureibacillus composti]